MGRPGDPRSGRRYRRFRQWATEHFAWVCVYCRLPIDAEVDPQSRWYCTLAHDVAVSERPDLTLEPSNILGLAHGGCNSSAYGLERYHGIRVPELAVWGWSYAW
jgi:hypothetical protein